MICISYAMLIFHGLRMPCVNIRNWKKVAEHVRRTPNEASKIRLRVDFSGKKLKAGQNDAVFVYADIVDVNGTVVFNASNKIRFAVTGNAV